MIEWPVIHAPSSFVQMWQLRINRVQLRVALATTTLSVALTAAHCLVC